MTLVDGSQILNKNIFLLIFFSLNVLCVTVGAITQLPVFAYLGPARAERRDRPRVPSSNGAKSSPAAAAAAPSAAADLVVDDDSSDDDDEDGPVMKDGTINASDRNPKPLRELLPIRSSAASASPAASSSNNAEHRVSCVPPLAAKGPSRPLPPTPDDDDTMTRRGGANGGGASGGLIMNSAASSPAIRSNMPDLLPQTPSGGPPTPVSRGGGGGHDSHHGAGPQGSPLTGLQVMLKTFCLPMFRAVLWIQIHFIWILILKFVSIWIRIRAFSQVGIFSILTKPILLIYSWKSIF